VVRSHQAHFLDRFPHAFLVAAPFYTLVSPVLYLFVRSLSEPGFSIRGRRWLHLVPFALALAYFAAAFYFRSADAKRAVLEAGGLWTRAGWTRYRIAYYAQILAYSAASAAAIGRYHRRLKDQLSSMDRVNLSWLRAVIFGFIAAWLVDVLQFALTSLAVRVPMDLVFADYLAFIVFYNIIFFKGWCQPRVFEPEARPKYQSSNLTPEAAGAYRARLESYAAEAKPFLDPELTLRDLSAGSGIPPRHLSQVLNETLGQNFFDYIGRLRIDEARARLADPSQASKTVLEIMYDVGFNSKSVFNALFKKATGVTPREFRRGLADQEHPPRRG
jgi:AraC-like DNA-binding protein